ncbi:hypothetical protein [Agrobacterium sp. NPDC089420]|uniref:hypothetical protein n=1 Tax=Agrobacterium sp. NPDC089420 TaxID=3363918 RepID=UPI00384D4AA4
MLDGTRLFDQNGRDVMPQLERRDGALQSVGIVLFANLGMSTDQLHQSGREDHSITVFARVFGQIASRA